jgi:hypothetical protein
MSPRSARALILTCLLLAAVALSGCRNPDAPTTGAATATATSTTGAAAPQNPGEPSAPAPPAAASQAPTQVRATPQAALTAFAALYVNWSFQTITAEQRTLAAMSVGAARLAEQQAAATSQSDSTISRGHIYNSGVLVSIAPDLTRAGRWVLVTREQTGGSTQYEGLPAGYHVTFARLLAVPGGYVVSQWLPQS